MNYANNSKKPYLKNRVISAGSRRIIRVIFQVMRCIYEVTHNYMSRSLSIWKRYIYFSFTFFPVSISSALA